MNPLQQAQENLDVVNFQIEQAERRGDTIPSVLLTQRAFYQGEIERLQVERSSWRAYQRPACEMSREEAAYLNSSYCHPAIDA